MFCIVGSVCYVFLFSCCNKPMWGCWLSWCIKVRIFFGFFTLRSLQDQEGARAALWLVPLHQQWLKQDQLRMKLWPLRRASLHHLDLLNNQAGCHFLCPAERANHSRPPRRCPLPHQSPVLWSLIVPSVTSIRSKTDFWTTQKSTGPFWKFYIHTRWEQ